jgi:hypothetical protein
MMKNLILFSLFFAVLSCASSEITSEGYTIVTIEIKETNGDLVNEIHFIAANDSIFLRNAENVSWVVTRPIDCTDCIPTILKKTKNIWEDDKMVIRHNKTHIVQNKSIRARF